MINPIQRAKVFLSCGQRTDYEKGVTDEVAQLLNDLGFDTYIAIRQQSLNALRENIFHQLEESEYYIFIDNKREEFLSNSSKLPENRGSLFSNQELAIASFLNLPIIAFQEKGIKKLDGLLSCLQVNTIEFDNGTDIPSLIIEKVKEKLNTGEWNAHWKARITPIKEEKYFEDTKAVISGELTNIDIRMFHIGIHNHHITKPVLNCCVFLERIFSLIGGIQQEIESSEIKWKGVPFPNVIIGPETIRRFDAFYINPKEPDVIHFHSLTDFSNYHISVHINSPFLALFVVISENFPIMRIPVTIHANDNFQMIDYSLGSPIYQHRS